MDDPWLVEAMDGRPEKRDSIHQGESGELLNEGFNTKLNRGQKSGILRSSILKIICLFSIKGIID